MLLLINRYKCPIRAKVSIKAFYLDDDYNVIKEYPKINGDNIEMFNNYKTILVTEVIRSHNLNDINIIKNEGK